MPITAQHQKEALGQAYVRAVIAKAGFNFAKDEFDYGLDGTIKEVDQRGDGRYFDTGFGINFQLKSTSAVSFSDNEVIYDLESKNYNDLIIETTTWPNILVLFVLPEDEENWLSVTSDRLVIKQCAWWCSLEGLPPTPNNTPKRIRIPNNQVFSPSALKELMEKVKGGDRL